MTEQLNFRNHETGTLLEDDNRIDFNVSNPDIMTPDELRIKRERDEMQRRLKISERQALGLPEKEDQPLSRHQEIGVITKGVRRLREDYRLAA